MITVSKSGDYGCDRMMTTTSPDDHVLIPEPVNVLHYMARGLQVADADQQVDDPGLSR